MSAPLAWLIFLLALIVAAPSIVPRLLARLIDRAKIVFAHDMGQPRNQALLDYFPSRRVWKLFVDGNQFDFREVSGLRKTPPFATTQSLTR